jgi:hypothetical protein
MIDKGALLPRKPQSTDAGENTLFIILISLRGHHRRLPVRL